jgi:hypothetical protein
VDFLPAFCFFSRGKRGNWPQRHIRDKERRKEERREYERGLATEATEKKEEKEATE